MVVIVHIYLVAFFGRGRDHACLGVKDDYPKTLFQLLGQRFDKRRVVALKQKTIDIWMFDVHLHRARIDFVVTGQAAFGAFVESPIKQCTGAAAINVVFVDELPRHPTDLARRRKVLAHNGKKSVYGQVAKVNELVRMMIIDHQRQIDELLARIILKTSKKHFIAVGCGGGGGGDRRGKVLIIQGKLRGTVDECGKMSSVIIVLYDRMQTHAAT